MDSSQPTFTGLHFFVRDMAATIAFYRQLGLDVPDGEHFVSMTLPGGIKLAFGTYALTRGYDAAFDERNGPSSNALQFDLPSREAVDALYDNLTSAGARGHLAPIDAFWGSRYAEVLDPDGNVVGFHSPSDASMKSAAPMEA